MPAMCVSLNAAYGRIGATIAVSHASASSCAHNIRIVAGTPSIASRGASAASQLIHGFRSSGEGSLEWFPAGFRFDLTHRSG